MGLGFSNIENRIKNIKGTFKLNSAIDEGFKFNFSFKE
jgi:signal transduction histidine kinase